VAETVELGVGTTIPIVDFAGFTSGDSAARLATATAIRRALEEFGFLYLRRHGVAQSVVDDLFAQAQAFFALPPEAKTRTAGYSAAGYRALDPTQPADLKEGFRAGPDFNGPRNVWPNEIPRLREAVVAYHQVAATVCSQVMQAVAVSFGLPDGYFAAAHEPHNGTVVILHYPPLSAPVSPGQLRSGAHTDFGTMTLLFHYLDAGGLEIQRPDGTWLAAPSVPGAAIVNAGDLLRRWTNDQLRSVLHRVVLPEGAATARSRYSAVLFYSPRPDALVTCLEPCTAADQPARYPPITAGAHIQAKLQETRRHAEQTGSPS
jgi:isopenicillin N synthase-like dioxygenase